MKYHTSRGKGGCPPLIWSVSVENNACIFYIGDDSHESNFAAANAKVVRRVDNDLVAATAGGCGLGALKSEWD